MKVFAALGLFSAVVHAFPTPENMARLLQRSDPQEIVEGLSRLRERQLVLNPLAAPISVTGAHAFQPPNFANGDQRGPCPGLNALANHGYLSRDGAVNYLDFIVGVNTVFGMGMDITTLLATLSAVEVGNLVSFSIGGPSPKVATLLGGLGGLLGTPRGVDVTHNLIEADGSSTRDDVYVTGDAWTMNMTRFLEVYNNIDPNGGMVMTDIWARAMKRFNESVATNPYFYYGPYSGLFARHGGYMFTGRLMSNHSAACPRGGYMTRDVYASFHGVYNVSGNLMYKPGWEQIPANWYRIVGDYTLADLAADILAMGAQYPTLLGFGGNLGAVNTYAGVDLNDVTGGLINGASILQGNNLLCLVLQAVKMAAPGMLASVWATVSTPLSLLSTTISAPMLNLTCPAFGDLKIGGTDLMSGLMAKYPGARKAGLAL